MNLLFCLLLLLLKTTYTDVPLYFSFVFLMVCISNISALSWLESSCNENIKKEVFYRFPINVSTGREQVHFIHLEAVCVDGGRKPDMRTSSYWGV